MSRVVWSKYMEKVLTDMYADHPSEEIAKKVRVTVRQVYNKANHMGLKKSNEYLNSAASGRIQKGEDLGRAYRFPKGLTPWNKGKKLPGHGCKRTMFKKGNEPHNTGKDGDISIRGGKNNGTYKYLRVAKGKWVLLHRKLWEDEYGKIPKGMILVFKNGDTLNCELDNLELITRKQHAANTRNKPEYIAKTIAQTSGLGKGKYDKEMASYIANNRPDLIELKRQQLKLGKALQNEKN